MYLLDRQDYLPPIIHFTNELKKIYDDPIAHFTEEAKRLTEEKKNSISPLSVSFNPQLDNSSDQKLFNAGYLFLQKIYYGLSLDKICSKIQEDSKTKYDLNNILKDLIFKIK